GIKSSQRLLGDVGPFSVDRGSAHAHHPLDRRDAVARAAAQVAGMITANHVGNPPGDEARRGHWQVRAMAEMWLGTLLILGIDLVLVGLVCAVFFVATTGLGGGAGSTAGAPLRRGRRAWRFRGGRPPPA